MAQDNLKTVIKDLIKEVLAESFQENQGSSGNRGRVTDPEKDRRLKGNRD